MQKNRCDLVNRSFMRFMISRLITDLNSVNPDRCIVSHINYTMNPAAVRNADVILTSNWSSAEVGALRKAKKEFWESWCLTPKDTEQNHTTVVKYMILKHQRLT